MVVIIMVLALCYYGSMCGPMIDPMLDPRYDPL